MESLWSRCGGAWFVIREHCMLRLCEARSECGKEGENNGVRILDSYLSRLTHTYIYTLHSDIP